MEEKVIIMLCKCNLSEREIAELKRIISQGVDWHRLFNLALNNKVIGLAYYNLVRYRLFTKVKPILFCLMKYYYIGNRERNIFLMQEQKNILEKMNANSIPVLKLKGGSLLDKIYKDYGSRTCNDLDFFCRIEDRSRIDVIMSELGYIQGEYDWENEEIQPLPRMKKIGWKANMNTFPIYMKKINNNPYVKFLEIDFSYAFDLRKDVSISNLVFRNSVANEMCLVDSIIYLCCHLYKEAENDLWIEAKADLQLSKFCDIRETIRKLPGHDFEILIERAFELKCEEAVYYCTYYSYVIYKEEMFWNILKSIEQKGYVLKRTKYDNLDYSQENTNVFMKRLFAYDNSEHLLSDSYIRNKRAIEGKE